jgi:TP901 family phage tail tape measure protein
MARKKDQKIKLDAEINVQLSNLKGVIASLDSALKGVQQINIISEDGLKRAVAHMDKLTEAALKLVSKFNEALEESSKVKVKITGVDEDSISKLKTLIQEALAEALSKVYKDLGSLIDLSKIFGDKIDISVDISGIDESSLSKVKEILQTNVLGVFSKIYDKINSIYDVFNKIIKSIQEEQSFNIRISNLDFSAGTLLFIEEIISRGFDKAFIEINKKFTESFSQLISDMMGEFNKIIAKTLEIGTDAFLNRMSQELPEQKVFEPPPSLEELENEVYEIIAALNTTLPKGIYDELDKYSPRVADLMESALSSLIRESVKSLNDKQIEFFEGISRIQSRSLDLGVSLSDKIDEEKLSFKLNIDELAQLQTDKRMFDSLVESLAISKDIEKSLSNQLSIKESTNRVNQDIIGTNAAIRDQSKSLAKGTAEASESIASGDIASFVAPYVSIVPKAQITLRNISKEIGNLSEVSESATSAIVDNLKKYITANDEVSNSLNESQREEKNILQTRLENSKGVLEELYAIYDDLMKFYEQVGRDPKKLFNDEEQDRLYNINQSIQQYNIVNSLLVKSSQDRIEYLKKESDRLQDLTYNIKLSSDQLKILQRISKAQVNEFERMSKAASSIRPAVEAAGNSIKRIGSSASSGFRKLPLGFTDSREAIRQAEKDIRKLESLRQQAIQSIDRLNFSFETQIASVLRSYEERSGDFSEGLTEGLSDKDLEKMLDEKIQLWTRVKESQEASLKEAITEIENILSSGEALSISDKSEAIKTTVKMDDNLKKLSLSFKDMQERVGVYNQQLRGTKEEQFNAAQGLSKIGTEANGSVNKIDKYIAVLKGTADESGDLSYEAKKLINELEFLRSKFSEVSLNTSKKSVALQRIRKDTKDASKGFADYGNKLSESIISNFRFAQSAAIIGAVVMSLKTAFTEVLNESKAYARTLTVMQSNSIGLNQIYKQLRDTVREISIEFGQSVTDSLEIVKQFGSAGLSAEKAMKGLRSAMQLVITTQANAESITRAMAGVYNVFGSELAKTAGEGKEFARIVDVMSNAYRNHQIELEEMTQGLKFVGATGKAAGFSFEDLTALLSILNDNMIKSGMAGRNLQVVFANIAAKADKLSEAFGVEINPDIKIQDQFLSILEKVNKRIGSGAVALSDSQKLFDIFGKEGARVFTILAQKVDDVKAAMTNLNEESEGVSEQLTSIVKAEVFTQWESARQALLEIGRDALEPMKKIIVEVTNVIIAFSDMLKKTGLGPFLNIIGYGTMIVGFLLTTLSGLYGVIVGAIFIVGKAGSAFALYVTSLKATSAAALETAVASRTLAASLTSTAAAAGVTGAAAGATGAAVGATGAAVGAAAVATSSFGKVIASLGMFLLRLVPQLAILAIIIGVAATAFYRFSDSSRKVKQDISDIIGKIRELNETSKRLKDFNKSFDEIRNQINNTSADSTVMGQKIRDAFEAAGDSVVSHSLIAGKSNKDLVNNFKDLAKSIDTVTLARKKLIEEQLKQQKINYKETTLRDLALLEDEAKRIDFFIDMSPTDDENQKDKIAELINFRNKAKEIYTNILEIEGGSLVYAQRAVYDTLLKNLKEKMGEKGLFNLQIKIDEMNLLSQASAAREGWINEWKPIKIDEYLDMGVRGSKVFQSIKQFSRELEDPLKDMNWSIRPVEKFVDVLTSTEDRLFDFVNLLSGPPEDGFVESQIEQIAILNNSLEEFRQIASRAFSRSYLPQSINPLKLRAELDFNSLDKVSLPHSFISKIAKDMSEGIGEGFSGAIEGYIADNINLSNLYDKDGSILGSQKSLQNMIEMLIRQRAGYGEINDITGEIYIDLSQIVSALMGMAENVGLNEKEYNNLKNTLEQVVFENYKIYKVQEFLNRNSKEYLQSLRKSVEAQAELNPLTKKQLDAQRLALIVKTRENNETKNLVAIEEKVLETSQQISYVLDNQNQSSEEHNNQIEDLNAKLKEVTGEYKAALDEVVQTQMAYKDIAKDITHQKNEQRRLNLLLKNSLNFSKSNVAKNLENLAVKKLEIQSNIQMLRLNGLLNGSEDQRRDALNQIRAMQLELIEIGKELNDNYHEQNGTILDTLHIFEEIFTVGENQVNQKYVISGIEQKLKRDAKDILRINSQLSNLNKEDEKSKARQLQLESDKIDAAKEFAQNYNALVKIQKDLTNQLQAALSKMQDIFDKILDFTKSNRDRIAEVISDLGPALEEKLKELGAIDFTLLVRSLDIAESEKKKLQDMFLNIPQQEDAIKDLVKLLRETENIDFGGLSRLRSARHELIELIEKLRESQSMFSGSLEKDINLIARDLPKLRENFFKELEKGALASPSLISYYLDLISKFSSRVTGLMSGPVDEKNLERLKDLQDNILLTQQEFLSSAVLLEGAKTDFEVSLIINNKDQVELVLKSFLSLAEELRDVFASMAPNRGLVDSFETILSKTKDVMSKDDIAQALNPLILVVDDIKRTLGSGSDFVKAIGKITELGGIFDFDTSKVVEELNTAFGSGSQIEYTLDTYTGVNSPLVEAIHKSLGSDNPLIKALENSSEPNNPLIKSLENSFGPNSPIIQLLRTIEDITDKISNFEFPAFLGLNRGGSVPGSGRGDIIPAMLEPGEYVIPKKDVSRIGAGFFEYIRSGGTPKGFTTGGSAGAISAARTSVDAAIGNATIEVNVRLDGAEAIKNAAEAIRKAAEKSEAYAKRREELVAIDSVDPENLRSLEEYRDAIKYQTEDNQKARKALLKSRLAAVFGKGLREMDKEILRTLEITSKWSVRFIKIFNNLFSAISKMFDVKALAESMAKTVVKAIEEIIQASQNNVQAIKQYNEQLAQINKQYRDQIDSLQTGLRRNSQSYWSYITAIEEAEKSRFEQMMENERQLREQLITSEKLFATLFTGQAKEAMDSFSGTFSGMFGEASKVKLDEKGNVVKDNDGNEVMEAGRGLKGLFEIQETSTYLDQLYGSIAGLKLGSKDASLATHDYKDVLFNLSKSLGSFSLDIFESVMGLAAQGFSSLIGMMSDPEQVDQLFEQFNDFITKFPEMAPEFIRGLIDNIENFVEAFAEAFPAILETLVELIPDVVESLIMMLATHLPEMIGRIIREIPGLILKLIPIIIKAVVVAAVNIIKEVLKTLWDFSLPGMLINAIFHDGGMIPGSKEVPILAQGGEGVLSRRGVATLGGPNVLNELNDGINRFNQYSKYHQGGMVNDRGVTKQSLNSAPMSSGRGLSDQSTNYQNSFSINVTVNGKMTDKEVSVVTDKMVEEIDKKLAKRSDNKVSKFDRK